MHLSTAGLRHDGDGRGAPQRGRPSAVALFAADAVTRTLLNGFYVVKTRLQVRRPRYHFCHAFVEVQTLWNEGLLGFLRGNAAGCVRIVPYTAAQWTTHKIADLLGLRVPQGLATAVAIALTYPLNTLQTRMTLSPTATAQYSTIFQELTNSKGGLIGGLYAGFLSVLPGQLAYQAGLGLADRIFLAIDEPIDERAHPTRAFVQSCLKATLANLLAYPFDTICVRMQAGVLADEGLLHCITNTYQEQGIGGFYQGVGVTMLKVLPFALFMYFTFNLTNKWFESHKRDVRFAGLHSTLHVYWHALSSQLEAGSLQWQSHAQRQFHRADQ